MKQQSFEVTMNISIPDDMVLISKKEYNNLLSISIPNNDNNTNKLLSKKKFMEKYHLKPTKYAERMEEVRSHPRFRECYVQVTGKEIWINEEIYQEFLIWRAAERRKDKFKRR